MFTPLMHSLCPHKYGAPPLSPIAGIWHGFHLIPDCPFFTCSCCPIALLTSTTPPAPSFSPFKIHLPDCFSTYSLPSPKSSIARYARRCGSGDPNCRFQMLCMGVRLNRYADVWSRPSRPARGLRTRVRYVLPYHKAKPTKTPYI